MGTVKSGLTKAAIFDPATGDVVQFNKIAAELTEFVKEPITTETSTGLIHGGFDSRMILGFMDAAGLSQLETWQNSTTQLQAVAAGTSFIKWAEPETISVERSVGVNARDGVTIHQSSIEHVSYSPDIFAFVNLIKAGADAFSVFDDGADFQYDLIFPVKGVTFTASADYSSHSTNTLLKIDFLDFSGAGISTSSETVTGNGRFSVSGVAPANTYKVVVTFDASSNFTAGNVTNRAIRPGNKSAHTDY